jgi:hypothetical protein
MKSGLNSTVESERALGRAVKKMKMMGNENLKRQSHIPPKLDPAADSAEDHHPNDVESVTHQTDRMVVITPTKTRRGPSRAMSVAKKQARQRLSDGQVAFIVHARYKNKPDAYNTGSNTSGPLPWSVVAELYNQEYAVSLGGAAMEKRARQHHAA